MKLNCVHMEKKLEFSGLKMKEDFVPTHVGTFQKKKEKKTKKRSKWNFVSSKKRN